MILGEERELELTQRLMVVREAESWLRTPYHHEGNIKGVGVDCAMLLVSVFRNCGLIPSIDPRPYSRQWHMHRAEEHYLKWVEAYAREIPGPPQPGDVALYQFGRCLSHGAIVIAWPKVIHAVAGLGCLWDDGEELHIRGKRPRRTVFYSYWG